MVLQVVKGIANSAIHSKCLNAVVEPVTGYSEHIAMARSYGVLKPGKGKADVCLRNHSVKQVTLTKQTAVDEITAAKIFPSLLVPKPTGHGVAEKEALQRKGKLKAKRIIRQN